MMRRLLPLGFFCLTLSCSWLVAQDEEKLASGPKVGTNLPSSFDCYNANGEAEGKFRSLVTKFYPHPSVFVFVRENAEEKDGAVPELLKKLDDAMDQFKDDGLKATVIYLSDAARSSADTKETDPAKLVAEAQARDALYKRLANRAMGVKNVIIACYTAEGPKGYQLNPSAEVTALFTLKHKVAANFAFEAGKMTPEDGDRIVSAVRKALRPDEKAGAKGAKG
jgi:hypothetical protein